MIHSFRRLHKNESGTVSVMVALLLPVLLGFAALVAEFGHGLIVKAENQRVADLAAFAGATTLTATQSTDEMHDAAKRVAALNGVAPTDVLIGIIDSPRNNGAQAVSVIVSTNKSLVLAPVVGGQSGLTIVANAAAEVSKQTTPGCVIALNAAQTGVTLSGGTAISAPSCAVASNSSVVVPCGTSINAKAVTYNSTLAPNASASPYCNGITATNGIDKAEATDPLAGDASVASATARLTTVSGYSAPSFTQATFATTYTDLDFPWWEDNNFKPKVQALGTGCDATYSGGWIVTCPAGGTYNFGTVKVQNVKSFQLSGVGSTTFNFKETLAINNGTVTFPGGTYNFVKGLTVTGGSTVSFGNGTYTINEGIKTEGGTTTTFGSGTFKIGAMTSACGGATHSICHEGTTLTFAGPSNFTITKGIYNKGGSTLNLGTGVGATTNTYNIGANSAGHALNVGGGSKTLFGDAVGSTVKFVGNLNMSSGGGSCLTLPAANNIDIKGYFASAGGNRLGAGVYTITDYMTLGASSGGNVSCPDASNVSSSIGVLANNVSIVLGGTTLPSSGSCSGQAFCIGAGYSSVNIVAPSSSKLAVIGPVSAGSAGATLTAGAGASISGVFYFPRGPILMSGGASLGNGTGQCLQIIGSRINLSGGTAAASACITNASAGSGTVMLVQ